MPPPRELFLGHRELPGKLWSVPADCLLLTLQTKEDQMQVIGNLKNISMASSKLLLAAKSLSVDPGAPNAKNLLAAAARYEQDEMCFVGV